MGKQWIRNYALAISKGMLAQVRGKFGAIPLPGDSVTLNASDLASQSQAEKEALKTELKELLDKLTYASMVEVDAKKAEDAKTLQVNVPMKIFVG
jgi:predicted GTPase